MPTTNTVLEAVYARVNAAISAPVSPELRRLGDPTPAVVYEMTGADFDIAHEGSPTWTGTATFRFDCVANMAIDAYNLALDVLDSISGKWTQGTVTCVLVSAGLSQSRATPDDGQEDAERTTTLTAELQFKEGNH